MTQSEIIDQLQREVTKLTNANTVLEANLLIERNHVAILHENMEQIRLQLEQYKSLSEGLAGNGK